MKQKHIPSVGKRLRERAALVQRGSARAAVLGVNDGLVSTLCLVVGVAATGAAPWAVLTAGLAGLLAGAISMSAGEWISVKAQVELFEGVLEDLKIAMKKDKQQLIHSLAHTLAGRGIDIGIAHKAASDVAHDDEHFRVLYSAQVIGLNVDELGSPWQAARSSFVLFGVGGFVPIIPWFFVSGHLAVVLSIVFTSIAGLFVGSFIAKSSGKSISYGALRQLLIILGSAAVTYGIGYVFGVVAAG